MFFQFDAHRPGPQGLVMPFGDTLDSMKTYLPNLKTFDDVELKEWMRKAENPEKEFAVKPDDSKSEADKKESLQRWYSVQRFIVEKKFFTSDEKLLTDADTMTEYLKGTLAGKGQARFDSVPLPEEPKNAGNLAATDFDSLIFTANKQSENLVLITNPNPLKNMNIEAEFDRFSKRLNKNVIASHYSGLNESECFKVPRKLPSILLFKRNEGSDQVQAIELDRNTLNKAFNVLDAEVDKDVFHQVMNDFIEAN